MTAFLDFHAFAAARGEGFTRNYGCFSSARQRLPFLMSPLGPTASCSQGQIRLLKLRGIA